MVLIFLALTSWAFTQANRGRSQLEADLLTNHAKNILFLLFGAPFIGAGTVFKQLGWT